MEKRCGKCRKVKDINEFPKHRWTRDGYRYQCKECKNQENRQYEKNYPEKHKKASINLRNRKRNKKLGITQDFVDNLFLIQKGCCAICGMHNSNLKKQSLGIDHDHATNKVRGLLCSKCNLLLGNANDNIYILDKAIKYLINNI